MHITSLQGKFCGTFGQSAYDFFFFFVDFLAKTKQTCVFCHYNQTTEILRTSLSLQFAEYT